MKDRVCKNIQVSWWWYKKVIIKLNISNHGKSKMIYIWPRDCSTFPSQAQKIICIGPHGLFHFSLTGSRKCIYWATEGVPLFPHRLQKIIYVEHPRVFHFSLAGSKKLYLLSTRGCSTFLSQFREKNNKLVQGLFHFSLTGPGNGGFVTQRAPVGVPLFPHRPGKINIWSKGSRVFHFSLTGSRKLYILRPRGCSTFPSQALEWLIWDPN